MAVKVLIGCLLGCLMAHGRKIGFAFCTILLMMMVHLQYGRDLYNKYSPQLSRPPPLPGVPEAFVQAMADQIYKHPAFKDLSLGVLDNKEKFHELAEKLALVVHNVGCDKIEHAVEEYSEFSSSDQDATLYVVTPTYRRPEQIAELTRLSQTLLHVPNLVWLVVEDADHLTPQVSKLLHETRLPYVHLAEPMPDVYRARKVKPRGVANRNRALQWIRANASRSGVMYFADDDNTYHVDLFKEIRSTKGVSMFPVGLCTKLGVSSPVIKNGHIVGFYDGWIAGRKFPVDMAGFAVNVGFLDSRPMASMPYKPGYEEDGFLRSLAPLELRHIEIKADQCTRILVWHTQTKRNEPAAAVDLGRLNNTNIIALKEQLV